MAQTKTSYKPGQSGNLKGRPKKGTALSDVLRTYMNRNFTDIDGKQHRGKTVFARIAGQAALTGTLVFPAQSPDGEQLPPVYKELDAKDWITWAKYVWDRLEGPVKQSHDITTKGESLNDAGIERRNTSLDALAAAVSAIVSRESAERDGAMVSSESAAMGGDSN